MKDTDQPSAGLIQDLNERRLIGDTLVVWGGRVRAHRLLPGQSYGDDYAVHVHDLLAAILDCLNFNSVLGKPLVRPVRLEEV